jgi:hypothetical protein
MLGQPRHEFHDIPARPSRRDLAVSPGQSRSRPAERVPEEAGNHGSGQSPADQAASSPARRPDKQRSAGTGMPGDRAQGAGRRKLGVGTAIPRRRRTGLHRGPESLALVGTSRLT